MDTCMWSIGDPEVATEHSYLMKKKNKILKRTGLQSMFFPNAIGRYKLYFYWLYIKQTMSVKGLAIEAYYLHRFWYSVDLFATAFV